MFNTIVDFLKFWRYETPDKVIYTFLKFVKNECHEKNITCTELYNYSCCYAGFLDKKGIQKGDRVIIIGDQTPDTIYAIYGTLMLGAAFVLVPPLTDAGKIKRLYSTLSSSEAKVIVGNKKYAETIEENDIEFIPSLDLRKKYDIDLDKLNGIKIELDDLACLQYTSGSINAPKGVMLSHGNIMESIKLQQTEYPTQMNDIHITWLPFFHTMELTCDIFFTIFTNRHNIFMRVKDFMRKPHRWFQSAANYHATTMTGPISGYVASVNDLSESAYLDLSSLKYMIASAEPIDKKNVDYVLSKLSKFKIKKNIFYSGLGMTEATTIITISQGCLKTLKLNSKKLMENKVETTSSNQHSRVVISSGKFSDNTDITIVNPKTCKECSKNEVGEVWISGPTVACGYWQLKDKTAATFEAKLPGKDGNYLRTGDLGFIYDNELYLVGRYKEVMIINGHNIYPKDIEYVIKDSVPELEQSVMRAFCININDQDSLIISIEQRDKVANYTRYIDKINHVIHENFAVEAYDIFFVETNGLPRTDNGKVAVNKIGNAYLSENLKILYSLKNKRNTEKSDFNETQMKIKEIFEEILKVKCNSPKIGFYELGGTSLKIISLLKSINNTFGVTLELNDLLASSTIESIEHYIDNQN